MFIPISLVIILITLHFLFDWVLQPREIAKAKGSSIDGQIAVAKHLLINITPFTILLYLILIMYGFEYQLAFLISVSNLMSHFLIDIYLPKGKNERQVINLTALDQILHLTTLFGFIALF